jgi:hypothetical protein
VRWHVRARAALHLGDLARGLAELERYDREFSGGILRPEASMLRIEALVQAGDLARARQLAEIFIATYPPSPHVARIRKLVGLGSECPWECIAFGAKEVGMAKHYRWLGLMIVVVGCAADLHVGEPAQGGRRAMRVSLGAARQVRAAQVVAAAMRAPRA